MASRDGKQAVHDFSLHSLFGTALTFILALLTLTSLAKFCSPLSIKLNSLKIRPAREISTNSKSIPLLLTNFASQ